MRNSTPLDGSSSEGLLQRLFDVRSRGESLGKLHAEFEDWDVVDFSDDEIPVVYERGTERAPRAEPC
jgi:hypothetical protein